jgi:D-alanine-D-alanine ligase
MRVGVLYHSVYEFENNHQLEKVDDYEMYETASAVSKALSEKGYKSRLIRISTCEPSTLWEQLKNLKRRFDLIFHLAESDGEEVLVANQVASYLKEIGLPFTGSEADALELCMNKVAAKELFLKNNIPTPKFQLFESLSQDIAQQLNPELRFPLIVKPVHEDGSYGIRADAVVKNPDELKSLVKKILAECKQPALVEEFIDGKEINAAVIGSREKPEVLPLSEIVFDFPDDMPRILSFEAKWVEDSPQYKGTDGRCPAEVPKHIEKKIKSLAKKAFQLTGCSDYARVDFRVRGEEVYVLEVNPNPWIGPDNAGFIRSAQAAGYNYDEIINKILEMSIERTETSYDSRTNN